MIKPRRTMHLIVFVVSALAASRWTPCAAQSVAASAAAGGHRSGCDASRVDLAARAFDRILPFDVPFFIAGRAPEGTESLRFNTRSCRVSGEPRALVWMPPRTGAMATRCAERRGSTVSRVFVGTPPLAGTRLSDPLRLPQPAIRRASRSPPTRRIGTREELRQRRRRRSLCGRHRHRRAVCRQQHLLPADQQGAPLGAFGDVGRRLALHCRAHDFISRRREQQAHARICSGISRWCSAAATGSPLRRSGGGAGLPVQAIGPESADHQGVRRRHVACVILV